MEEHDAFLAKILAAELSDEIYKRSNRIRIKLYKDRKLYDI